MSFWQTSDGTNVTDNVEKEYDGGGGDFPLIPDRTVCLLNIHSAAWDKDRDGNRYIKIRWDVVKPEPIARSVIFQKLWVRDDDPQAKDPAKKRDKALRMFAAIDANAGGKLAKAGREPDDDDLALALTNKQMLGRSMIWSMDDREQPGKKIEGNWISWVGPKGSKEITEMAAPPKRQEPDNSVDDDDVPF